MATTFNSAACGPRGGRTSGQEHVVAAAQSSSSSSPSSKDLSLLSSNGNGNGRILICQRDFPARTPRPCPALHFPTDYLTDSRQHQRRHQ
mmetsp:Transcript_98504/g.205436  ORF Transcript_98504/g.205436 Transcript_98504/m.205436 type:complete len:90 (+) Transcript_98504:38-307(+)